MVQLLLCQVSDAMMAASVDSASGQDMSDALLPAVVCACVCFVQDVDQRRHLLRLWVAPSAEEGAHPLAPSFAELYHATEPGNRGGIYIEGYTETIPLEAEVGNKLAT